MKKLGQGAIGTGSGTLLYTVPTGMKCDVKDIGISNTTTSTITCKLHFVPAGVAVAASNLFFPDISIPANSTVQWKGLQSLNTGDFLQGIGSASGLSANISGDEYR